MKLPSKITSYKESNLSKMLPIIFIIEHKDISISALYKQTKKYFNSIDEFLDVLDCLYAINKIRLTEKEELHYVA